MAKINSMFTFKNYQEVSKKLKDSNKFNEDMFWFNVVSPFLMSLGYNLYDLDGADFDAENKVIYFDVYDKSSKDKVVISCGLFDLNIDDVSDDSSLTHMVVNEKKAVHYLYFNMEELSATLYLILNDAIYQITKSVPDQDKADKKFHAISLRIARNNIIKGFTENGKSYFTSMVLMGLLTRESYVGNNFIEETLIEMFKNPSDELIQLLASDLRKSYISKSVTEEQVIEKVQPIKKTFMEVVKSTLKRDDDSNGYNLPDASSDYADIEIEEAKSKAEYQPTEPVVDNSKEDIGDIDDVENDINILGQNDTDKDGTDDLDSDSDSDITYGNEDDLAYGVFGDDEDGGLGSLNFLSGNEDDSDEEPDHKDLKSILDED